MAKNLIQNCCELVNTTPGVGTEQLTNPFGLVLVQKQTVAAVASAQFIGLANYPYKTYRLVGNYTASSGAAVPIMQISTNNGSSYISTNYEANITFLNPNTGVWTPTPTTNGFSIGPTTVNNVVSLDLFNMNGTPTGSFVMIAGLANGANGGTAVFCVLLSYYLTTPTTANAFQLLSTGTFTGTFALYGYN